MTKSYKRDKDLLKSTLEYVDKINRTLKLHRITLDNVISNDLAIDSCAFYLSQIGELAKSLTEDSALFLYNATTIDLKLLVYCRNMIDHDYTHMNRSLLIMYLRIILSKDFTCLVANRIDYCYKHAKGK